MDPTIEIIKKCMDLMKADPDIVSFVGDKIYDRVPEKQDNSGNVTTNVQSPYISLGNTSLLSDDFDCINADTINLQWDVWSWGDGEAYSSVEVRKIAKLVKKCLNKVEIELDQNGLVDIQHIMTNFNRARDGITNQATLTFEILIDEM